MIRKVYVRVTFWIVRFMSGYLPDSKVYVWLLTKIVSVLSRLLTG